MFYFKGDAEHCRPCAPGPDHGDSQRGAVVETEMGFEHGENGEGRTVHGASISSDACVSVSAGCFPPFKAVMFSECVAHKVKKQGCMCRKQEPNLRQTIAVSVFCPVNCNSYWFYCWVLKIQGTPPAPQTQRNLNGCHRVFRMLWFHWMSTSSPFHLSVTTINTGDLVHSCHQSSPDRDLSLCQHPAASRKLSHTSVRGSPHLSICRRSVASLCVCMFVSNYEGTCWEWNQLCVSEGGHLISWHIEMESVSSSLHDTSSFYSASLELQSYHVF